MNKEERLKAAEATWERHENQKALCYKNSEVDRIAIERFIAGAEAEAESKNPLTDEEMRQPIEDALYSTKHFLTTQASEFADGILLYLKEAGYIIIKTP